MFAHNEPAEKEVKETIPFIIASKRTEQLFFTMVIKCLYIENYRIPEREIKDNTKISRIPIFMTVQN